MFDGRFTHMRGGTCRIRGTGDQAWTRAASRSAQTPSLSARLGWLLDNIEGVQGTGSDQIKVSGGDVNTEILTRGGA
jgi:hypothetical protein